MINKCYIPECTKDIEKQYPTAKRLERELPTQKRKKDTKTKAIVAKRKAQKDFNTIGNYM